MVECNAPIPTFAPARALIVSSIFVAYLFVGSWPAANMQSTLARGPTWAGFPLKVGDLTQEYLPLSWKSVYFGTVSSSHGWRSQFPSYQECFILSFTLSLKNAS